MVGITLLWSTGGYLVRQVETTRAFELTFWRSGFDALALIVLLPLLRGPRRFIASIRAGGVFLALSTVCWSIMYTAFLVALTLTTVANVLVTMALGPLFTAIVARVALGHRIAPRTALAILIAGAGIAWMNARGIKTGDPRHLQGMLVALAVPIAGAVHWTLIQHNQRTARVDLLPAVLLGAIVSSLGSLPWALPFTVTTQDVQLLALLGVVQLALPCAAVVLVARSLSAPEAALLALLEVPLGVAWAWLGAGEEPSVHVLGGGLLVLGALVGNELLGLRRWRL